GQQGWAAGSDAASVARGGKPSGGFYKRQMVGTLEYMAPELLLRTAPHSPASDVYAWAVTVNEVATGVVPFSDCTKDNPEVHTVLEMGYGRLELAAAVSAEGLRPLLPRSCPPALAALLGACWAAQPEQRPSFTQIREALERIAREDLPEWEAQQQEQQQQLQQQQEQAGDADDDDHGDGSKVTHGSHPLVVVDVDVMVSDALDVPDTDPANGYRSMGHQSTGGAKGSRLDAPAACDKNNGGGYSCGDGKGQVHAVGGHDAAAALAPALHASMWPFILLPPGGAGGGGNSVQEHPESNETAAWLMQLPQQQPLPEQQDSAPAASAGSTLSITSTSSSGLIFNGGVFEAIGPRDAMEDRWLLLQDLWGRQQLLQPQLQPEENHAPAGAEASHALPPVLSPAPHPSGQSQEASCTASGLTSQLTWDAVPAVPLAAVFDGHRGGEAAEFCRGRLAEVLRDAVRESGSPEEALRSAFARLEEGYHAHWKRQRQLHPHLATGPRAFPGATALVALLAPGGRLYVANAGDCRAVLCRGRRAFAASRDHTGLLTDERRRVAAAGLPVQWQHGGWRIGTSGLQVTRCIGDFDVKGGLPAVSEGPGSGVTAAPEITF
ncbi:hypothetical protein Agub_g10536, partial [Astrephomene gubernaculifera]